MKKNPYKKVKFPKRERQRIENAIYAMEKLRMMGFNCQDEITVAWRALDELIRFDNEPCEKIIRHDWNI